MDISYFLASQAPTLTHWIGKLLNSLYTNIGSFGWSVVIFTIIIKVLFSPMDIWQRLATRKQTKAMKRAQPQLEKLQKQYSTRPDLLQMEQRKLYKKEGVSMFSTIIPMLFPMILFFIIFAGFNAFIKYKNEKIVYDIYVLYVEKGSSWAGSPEGQAALAAAYKPESWLWIKNIFMPDTWADVIPNSNTFLKAGIGGINGDLMFLGGEADYEDLVGPAMAKLNKKNFWDIKRWNGYLVLPVLSIILSFVSAKFLSPQAQPPAPMPTAGGGDASSQEAMKKTQEKSMKIMSYSMPVMMGVFSLFYSGAFSIYMFVSSLFSTVLSFSLNLWFKHLDKKEEDYILTTTIKK